MKKRKKSHTEVCATLQEVNHLHWFVDAVKRGLEEVQKGELIGHQAVVERWESRRRAKVDARRS